MLVEGFYSIVKKEVSENEIAVSVSLNPEHPIYKGHFANQPVVPGVMQIEIVRELMESELEQVFFINSIRQIKYFIPIVPLPKSKLTIELSYNLSEIVAVKFAISSGDQLYTKGSLKLTYEA